MGSHRASSPRRWLASSLPARPSAGGRRWHSPAPRACASASFATRRPRRGGNRQRRPCAGVQSERRDVAAAAPQQFHACLVTDRDAAFAVVCRHALAPSALAASLNHATRRHLTPTGASRPRLAMQKVVGSSPIIRSLVGEFENRFSFKKPLLRRSRTRAGSTTGNDLSRRLPLRRIDGRALAPLASAGPAPPGCASRAGTRRRSRLRMP